MIQQMLLGANTAPFEIVQSEFREENSTASNTFSIGKPNALIPRLSDIQVIFVWSDSNTNDVIECDNDRFVEVTGRNGDDRPCLTVWVAHQYTNPSGTDNPKDTVTFNLQNSASSWSWNGTRMVFRPSKDFSSVTQKHQDYQLGTTGFNLDQNPPNFINTNQSNSTNETTDDTHIYIHVAGIAGRPIGGQADANRIELYYEGSPPPDGFNRPEVDPQPDRVSDQSPDGGGNNTNCYFSIREGVSSIQGFRYASINDSGRQSAACFWLDIAP